jgi:hypothetical protein
MAKRLNARNRREKGIRIGLRDADEVSPDQQPPIFCLRYLDNDDDFCLRECDKDQKAALVDTLHRLSQITWTQLKSIDRHKMGFEKITQKAIRGRIPPHITEEVVFIAFRFWAMAPMVGYRNGAIFHIIWLDRKFRLYKH